MTQQSGSAGIASGSPAGGVLSGTYPSPAFAQGALGLYAVVSGATAFALTTSPGNAVVWGALEASNAALWVAGTPTRFIAVAAGLYRIRAHMQFGGGATARWVAQIKKNGATYLSWDEHGDALANPTVWWDETFFLAANDYVETWVFTTGTMGSFATTTLNARATLLGAG